MARSGSPTRFNGYEDDPVFQNVNYTQDISQQMRVPKRIRATGEYFDDLSTNNHNGGSNSWNYNDKIDMTVPDRIVVMGQDQHLGTRSAPREIILENSILPVDKGLVRVSTPPRVISLSDHHFPSASDEPTEHEHGQGDFDLNLTDPFEERRVVSVRPRKLLNQSELVIDQSRGETPPIGLTPSEEVLHLRRQLAKLNRRVLSIELDSMQRQQRDKIVYCIGLAYFLLKAIMWLNKS